MLWCSAETFYCIDCCMFSFVCHVGFQLMVTILNGPIGVNAVKRVIMAFRSVTDPA